MTTALDRRGFLRAGAGVAALGATGIAARPAVADDDDDCGRRIPRGGLGMHLYTMRGPLATDYPGSLERLRDIGYRTIGVSGRFGHSAAARR